MSNGKDTEPSLQRNLLATLDHTEFAEEQEDSGDFVIPFFKIRICKALIPLKVALFIWYGAGSAISTFLTVFYKQRGMTLFELSTIHTISPFLQVIHVTLCGIIADKIGRPKPVLVVNILLTVILVFGMLIVPSINLAKCTPEFVVLKRNSAEYGQFTTKTSCDDATDVIDLTLCNMTCSNKLTQFCGGQNKTMVAERNWDVSKDIIELTSCNITYYQNDTQYCDERNLVCDIIEREGYSSNFPLSIGVRWMYQANNTSFYNFTSCFCNSTTHSLCAIIPQCNITCLVKQSQDCIPVHSGRSGIVILAVLYVLFQTAASTTYRFMDVTVILLVKEHNSDFGLQRIFSMAGILFSSSLAGFIIDKTTINSNNKNYAAVLYLFIAMAFLLLVVLYKVEVHIRSPGKRLWKHSVSLMKNFDIICFEIVLIVLGTNYMFNRYFRFWYLEGLNASSLVLGLINAVNSLYGLPFLLTSHWWVKKIGTNHIFILALLGYIANGVGYSLLYDPWMALLVETTNIFTYHLLWVAVVVRSYEIAPKELTSTVIAVAGALHYNTGGMTGSLIGGLIMNEYGGRIAFRVLAVISLTTAVFYTAYLYTRKMRYPKIESIDLKGDA